MSIETTRFTESCSILLVEDEAISRQLLLNRLQELPNLTVNGLPNGLCAKEYLLEHVVDLVITDIRMPIMDGIQLTEFINTFCPETLVVILSGYGEFEYAQKAIQYGVQDYLLKPLQMQHLLSVVGRCVRKIRANRLALIKERYNPHYELETALQRALKEDKIHDELALINKCNGTVVRIKPQLKNIDPLERIDQEYRKLLGGVFNDQIVLSLGLFKSEYLFLILREKDKHFRSLNALPEYLNRVLVNKVEWTEYAEIHSLQELKALDIFSSIEENSLVIERACKYMEEHLGESISRTQVAEHVYLSPSYFGSLFKQVMGVGYNTYLTDLRIEKAKILLQKNMSVNDVAAKVGYRDAKYFSEVFTQKTGCFPSDYKFLLLSGKTSRDE